MAVHPDHSAGMAFEMGAWCPGEGMEAEEHVADDGHDEDVDIETVDEEPEQAPGEQGEEEKAHSAAEEPQPSSAETQVQASDTLAGTLSALHGHA